MMVLNKDKIELDIDTFEYKPELPRGQEWLEIFSEARGDIERNLMRYRAWKGWLEKQKEELLELLAKRGFSEDLEYFFLFLIWVYVGIPLICVNKEIKRLEEYLPEKGKNKTSKKFIDADEIKRKVDIVRVVSDYVELKKSGKGYMGRCPFHDDKHPSFAVYEEGYYICYGCGASGDVIDFIMQIKNCSFKEALEILKDY
jgi:hypothetical protein